jgi:hypothetical protein
MHRKFLSCLGDYPQLPGRLSEQRCEKEAPGGKEAEAQLGGAGHRHRSAPEQGNSDSRNGGSSQEGASQGLRAGRSRSCLVRSTSCANRSLTVRPPRGRHVFPKGGRNRDSSIDRKRAETGKCGAARPTPRPGQRSWHWQRNCAGNTYRCERYRLSLWRVAMSPPGGKPYVTTAVQAMFG